MNLEATETEKLRELAMKQLKAPEDLTGCTSNIRKYLESLEQENCLLKYNIKVYSSADVNAKDVIGRDCILTDDIDKLPYYLKNRFEIYKVEDLAILDKCDKNKPVFIAMDMGAWVGYHYACPVDEVISNA